MSNSSATTTTTTPAIAGSMAIPSMRFQDAPAAIEWLERVLGFERQAVYMNTDGTVAHAQLTFHGGGMVMLGSASNPTSRYSLQPEQAGGVTHGVYLVVPDTDAVYARAKAANAEIVRELQDTDYGSREFSCRDREGYVWSVGTYNPWKTTGPE